MPTRHPAGRPKFQPPRLRNSPEAVRRSHGRFFGLERVGEMKCLWLMVFQCFSCFFGYQHHLMKYLSCSFAMSLLVYMQVGVAMHQWWWCLFCSPASDVINCSLRKCECCFAARTPPTKKEEELHIQFVPPKLLGGHRVQKVFVEKHFQFFRPFLPARIQQPLKHLENVRSRTSLRR